MGPGSAGTPQLPGQPACGGVSLKPLLGAGAGQGLGCEDWAEPSWVQCGVSLLRGPKVLSPGPESPTVTRGRMGASFFLFPCKPPAQAGCSGSRTPFPLQSLRGLPRALT